MTDDQQTTPQNERINVFISPEAKAMMEEMGRALFPALKRSGGMIVDAALREKYATFKRGQAQAKAKEQKA